MSSTQQPDAGAQRVALSLNDKGEYVTPVDVPAGSAFHYWDGEPKQFEWRHTEGRSSTLRHVWSGNVAPHVHLAAPAPAPAPAPSPPEAA